jgi:hypothetical protein
MSSFNRKGFMNIPAQQADGTIKHISVKIGSPLHKRYICAA